jgi:hypothetical protein
VNVSLAKCVTGVSDMATVEWFFEYQMTQERIPRWNRLDLAK